MKCETCFWVKVKEATSATRMAECEFSTDVKLVGLGNRCANWTFNGKPACKDCRYYDRGFCVLEVPAAKQYSEPQYSEPRETDDWCGRFKGVIK